MCYSVDVTLFTTILQPRVLCGALSEKVPSYFSRIKVVGKLCRLVASMVALPCTILYFTSRDQMETSWRPDAEVWTRYYSFQSSGAQRQFSRTCVAHGGIQRRARLTGHQTATCKLASPSASTIAFSFSAYLFQHLSSFFLREFRHLSWLQYPRCSNRWEN